MAKTYRVYIPSRGTSFTVEALNAGAARRKALKHLGWTEANVKGTGFYLMRDKAATNPALKLPANWTNAQVRVNEQGKVQLKLNRLPSSGRAVKGVQSVTKQGQNPSAAQVDREWKKENEKRRIMGMAPLSRKDFTWQWYIEPTLKNPSKRSTIRRVRKALTKYVRGNKRKK